MGEEAFAVLSLAARYWFFALALFVLVTARLAFSRDRRQAKKKRDWSRARLVGEFAVRRAEDDAPEAPYEGEEPEYGLRRVPPRGEKRVEILPIPEAGILGSSRRADARVRGAGVMKRHLAFEKRGSALVVTPFPGAETDAGELPGPPYVLSDGDALRVGDAVLTLAFYDPEDARKPEVEADEEQQDDGEEEWPWPDDNPLS